MTSCTTLTLSGGQRAIVCEPKKRKPCCACGAAANLLCGWKVGASTCDAPICEACAVTPAPDNDFCPEHAEALEAWRASGQP